MWVVWVVWVVPVVPVVPVLLVGWLFLLVVVLKIGRTNFLPPDSVDARNVFVGLVCLGVGCRCRGCRYLKTATDVEGAAFLGDGGGGGGGSGGSGWWWLVVVGGRE